MEAEILQFINHWLYDADRMLRDRLESLKDDLSSDDEQTKKIATAEAVEILNWLNPPLPPLSAEEKLGRVKKAANIKMLSAEDQLLAVQRATKSTGRPRGRPRNETSQQAIRALGLHLATSLSWREIALEIRGCEHKKRRPNPERSCVPCGDAIRDAATRLQSFLKKIGYEFAPPLGREFDEESRREIFRLWHIG